MSKSKGNVIDPWDDLRRRTAPTRCAGTSSRPGQPWTHPAGVPRTASARPPARRCSRSGTSSRSSPPTPTSTAGRRDRRPIARTPTARRSTDGCWPSSTTRSRTVTDALEGFDALEGATRLGPLRRRPVQLVRAAVAGPGSGRAAIRAAHATLHRVPRHHRPAARAVLPVPGRRDLHGAHRRGVGAPERLAGADVAATTPRWPRRWTPARRLVGARPGGPHRRQGEGAPAAARGPCCCTPASRSTTSCEREIAAELNVKALEDIDTLSGLMSWTVVPNFRVLGPRLGPKVNEVKQALAAADGSALHGAARRASGFVEMAGERLERRRRRGAGRAPRGVRPGRGRGRGRSPSTSSSTTTCASRALARELVRALNDLRKEHGPRDRRPGRADRRRRPSGQGRGRSPPRHRCGRGAGHVAAVVGAGRPRARPRRRTRAGDAAPSRVDRLTDC